jgi:hypothetical protein
VGGALFGLPPGRFCVFVTLPQSSYLLCHLAEELLDLLGVITPPTLSETAPLDRVRLHLRDINVAGTERLSRHDPTA